MRCGDNLRLCLQRVVGRRLLLEHVERRATDVAGLDRVGERFFVNQVAARSVDDAEGTGLPRNVLAEIRKVGAVKNAWAVRV